MYQISRVIQCSEHGEMWVPIIAVAAITNTSSIFYQGFFLYSSCCGPQRTHSHSFSSAGRPDSRGYTFHLLNLTILRVSMMILRVLSSNSWHIVSPGAGSKYRFSDPISGPIKVEIQGGTQKYRLLISSASAFCYFSFIQSPHWRVEIFLLCG